MMACMTGGALSSFFGLLGNVCVAAAGVIQLGEGKSVWGGVLLGAAALLAVGNLWLLVRARRASRSIAESGSRSNG